MSTKQSPTPSRIFSCVTCNYTTSNSKDYNKHLLTRKHRKSTILLPEIPINPCTHFQCICGKIYKERTGLWRHKQKCTKNDDVKTVDEPSVETTPQQPSSQVDMMVVLELLKQNQEFKDLLIEQNKQMLELANKAGHNTNCNNTTNNKFNLNIFLNETCKDAISMDDFIKSFEVTRDEFLHTGKVGYIEGLSSVMANRFKDMDVHTRPLHCTDLKRETIYIKNADKWEKDDADKTKMRKAVRGVARKNKQEMWRWYDDNKPEVEQIGTDVCEDYFQYHRSTLGGYGKEEDLKFEDKIIKNVIKGVHVDKSSAVTI